MLCNKFGKQVYSKHFNFSARHSLVHENIIESQLLLLCFFFFWQVLEDAFTNYIHISIGLIYRIIINRLLRQLFMIIVLWVNYSNTCIYQCYVDFFSVFYQNIFFAGLISSMGESDPQYLPLCCISLPIVDDV